MDISSPAAGGTVDVARPVDPSLIELFTPRQIFWASVWASPLSGAVLCALNLRTLGRRGGATLVSMVLALLAVIAALDVAFPKNAASLLSTILLQIASIAGLSVFARRTFSSSIRIANRRSNHLAAFVCMVTATALFAVYYFGVQGLARWGAGSIREQLNSGVHHGDDEWIYYSNGASRNDAERLASSFVSVGIFDGTQSTSVGLERRRGRPNIRATYPAQVIESGEAKSWADAAAPAIANALVGRECVTISLLDEAGIERDRVDACPQAED